jgi:DUF1680 family protein
MDALELFSKEVDSIMDKLNKYEKIKQQQKESMKRYYNSHKEKCHAIQKSYYNRNKEKFLELDRNLKRNRYNNDPEYREKVLERNRLLREKKRLLKESQEYQESQGNSILYKI